MRIDLDYLKQFIAVDLPEGDLKELLASLGIEVAEVHRHGSSTAFSVEITPNRPDWLSHVGIAREIHARCPDRRLTNALPEGAAVPGEDGEAADVEIQSPEDCRRYTGCLLHDLDARPAPAAAAALIESLGLRPINRIVDASNLVLMGLGHPIHMFDFDRLAGGRIVVRRAKKGESLRLLDGRDVELTPEDLVIADAEKPVALAGIMGGAASGVAADTRRVFVESAWFDPVRVRLTARRLGLQTDASYRFERGADVEATPEALRMVIRLLEEWSGSPVRTSGYRDEYPGRRPPVVVSLPADYPSRYAGFNVPREAGEGILRRLGFAVADSDTDTWKVTVPSFRVDIECKQDLVEEIVRVHGYEHIPAAVASTVNREFVPASLRSLRALLGGHLVASGYHQAIHYSFQSETDNLAFAKADAGRSDFVFLRNPLGRDFACMRNSLIPGLLRSTALNVNNGAESVKLFETGHCFWRRDGEFLEQELLAVTAWGVAVPPSWRRRKAEPLDFFVFRAEMQALMARTDHSVHLEQTKRPWLLDDCGFALMAEGREIGWMGCLTPAHVAAVGLTGDVPAMEVRMAALLPTGQIQRFQDWNRLPAVRRDLSVFIPPGVSYAEVKEAIQRNRPEELESYRLFDYYRGGSAEKVSLAMSFFYRHSEQTLTGEEVNRLHAGLVEALESDLHLEPR